MKLIDTHSHLFVDEFKLDLNQIVERAKARGIIKIFMPNIDVSTIDPLLNVASEYAGYCLPMIGLHPTSVNKSFEAELSQMKELLNKDNSFVAIGEVGMDLYWDKTFEKEQRIAFDTQIQWSLEYNLPLIIHSRNSFDEVYSIIKRYSEERISGIFHSFTGNLKEVERLMEFEDFKLGINGVVTFKNSELPAVLKHVPIEKIVLETDSPYLTPVPYRGRRNESAHLGLILSKLSEIYQIPEDEMGQLTTENALKVFKMKKDLIESL